MKANYHTHTWRCNHASGTEEEYVCQAIASGIEILGFSDHAPYIFPNGYSSHIRMRPDQLRDYTDTVLSLKKKYADSISIHVGLETEYFPRYFADEIAFLRDSDVEYMILGQHYIVNEPDRYSGAPTDDVGFLKQYCHQTMEAMQTGLFSYFAHPDLIHFVGDPAVYHRYMTELMRETANCGLCAEINLLGLREDRHYPSYHFLEAVADADCPVVMGVDAHDVDAFKDTEAEKTVRKLAAEFGLNLRETIELRSIH